MTKEEREQLEIERRKIYAWLETWTFKQARQHGKSEMVYNTMKQLKKIEEKLAKC